MISSRKLLICSFLLFIASYVYSQDCFYFPVLPLGVSDKNIIDDKAITASSSLTSDTLHKYGRLHYGEGFIFNWWLMSGAGSWVAKEQNTQQYIQVDLGKRHVIKQIGTQGRQGARQFVTDYYVFFSDSDSANTWSIYKDNYGEPYLFDANIDDSNVTIQSLKHPIVARYVRILPQRWHNLIALRFELFGCEYKPNIASFDGKSRIDFRLDLPQRAVQTVKDKISFRFRTNKANGLILYGDDGQGDYFSVELFRGHLRLEICLGKPIDQSEDIHNYFDAGSLMDDNQWHDVLIQRDEKLLNITVDRIEMWRNISAAFIYLNMNRNLSLGGLPNYQSRDGLSVTENFVGCLEEVWFNGVNIIRDALRQEQDMPQDKTLTWWEALGYPPMDKQMWLGRQTTEADLNITGFAIVGSLDRTCPSTSMDASIVTFPGKNSYITSSQGTGTVMFYFDIEFRTFNRDGTLFYHQKDSHSKFIWIAIDSVGKLSVIAEWAPAIRPLSYTIKSSDPYAADRQFADGMWHKLNLAIRKDEITVIVDTVVYKTAIKFTEDMQFGDLFYIGGARPHQNSFQGCMRSIRVNNQDVDISKLATSGTTAGIVKGTCSIIDRCNPNPCKRQAPCTQSQNMFNCDCSLTGYEGAVCHQSTRPSSCSEVALLYSRQSSSKNILIDLDGSGALPPINVTCDFTDKRAVYTIVDHDVEEQVRVDGFQDPGAYKRQLDYRGASRDTLSELVRRAEYCEQSINYKCYNSKLLDPKAGNTANTGTNFRNRAWGWWVGRRGQPRYYWGGSVPGLQRCACGLKGNCEGDAETCNCDGYPKPPSEDSGLLTYKNDLPVMAVQFGDTGSVYDDKFAYYQVGPLRCYGDSVFDNTVTFRKADASIQLDPIYSEEEFDLTFLFKTTIFDAVIMQNVDKKTNYMFEVRIRLGNSMRFSFNVGNGLQIVEVTTANWLNDNQWHTVRLERNRKNARLKIDEQNPAEFVEPTDRAFQPFKFDSPLFLGSTQAYTDGYLGCITNLIINGVVQDIRGMVTSGQVTYGLSPGCKPKCANKPCLNRGECFEYYSHYYCECGLTAYRGHICGREVGASFGESAMVNLTFVASNDKLGSLDEYMQIGFKTKEKTGILMQMSSADHKEYIILKVNKQGGITVELNLGFEWQEIAMTQSIDLCNNQHHTLVVWRTNLGKIWHIKVDDYEETRVDYTSMLSEDSDTRLDNPTYLYIGRNGTMEATAGFKGCLYKAQWNNIFPLRMLYAEPPLNNVKVVPSDYKVLEDKCGYIEIMPVPDPIEVRPYPTIPANLQFDNVYLERESYTWVIIVVILVFVFFLLILFCCCFFRNFTIKKGVYDTHESSGTKKIMSPDLAVKYGTSGQPGVGQQEWFM